MASEATGSYKSRLEQRLADVRALAEALAPAHTTKAVAGAMFEYLLPLFGAAGGTLVLRTEEGDALELVGAVGYSGAALDAFRRIPLDASTPGAHVVRTGQPLWIESNRGRLEDFTYFMERTTGHEAFAVLPLVLDTEATGALVLAFAEERSFPAHERLLLVAMAGQCAVALQRAGAFARERSSRERLELALQAATMGIWDWDLRTNKLAWSPQLEAMHGLPPGGFGSGLDRYYAHLHPHDRERVRAEIDASLQTGALDIEYRGIWPDGTLHWFEARGQLSRDSDGRPATLRGVCIDVTQRKHAEEALRQSEERFRLLVDGVKDYAIIMLDAEGRVASWNQGAERIQGYTADEIVGQSFKRFYTPESLAIGLPERELEGAARVGTFEDEGWRVCKDGSRYWANVVITAMPDQLGRLVGYSMVTRDLTAQRDADEALREAESRFHTMTDNSPVLIWMDGPRQFVNRYYLEFFGLPWDAIAGTGWIKLLHPDDIDGYVGVYRAAYERRERFEYQCRFRRHDGEYRWLHNVGVPYFGPDGALVGFIGCSFDVTEQRWTEALVDGERRALEMLARGEPLAAVLATLCLLVEDLAGRGLQASLLLLDDDGSHLRHGAAPSLPEAYNRQVDDLPVGPSSGSCGTAAFRGEAVIVTDIANDPLWAEYRALAESAGLRACWSTPIRGSDGRILGTFALYYHEPRAPGADHRRLALLVGRTAAVVIERRRADESQARLVAIVGASDDAIIRATLDGIVTDWNPGAVQLYGVSADEMVRQPILRIIPSERRREYARAMARVRRGERVPAFDTVRRHRDGHVIHVSLSLSPIRDESGGVVGVSAIARDITARKQMELERARLYESEKTARSMAEAAIRARDEFVAVVSHDLRNPLTALSAQVQMVRRRLARGEAPTAGELVERLDGVQSSIAALTRQIDELFDATRLQVGRPLDLRLAPTDVVKLTRDCVDSLQHTSDDHRLRFETTVAELVGDWDAARLERVFANLLANAMKYSPSGGDVLVEISRDGAEAVIAVTDHGLGIPEADLPHIFERFRRASNVGRLIAGSGLGLAGARDIVEQHGGTISVQSEEGRGSRFTVRLPLEKGEQLL